LWIIQIKNNRTFTPMTGLQNGGQTKSQGWVMGSKNMLKSTSFSIPLTPSSHGRLFHTHRLLFSVHSSKPISRDQPFSLKTNGFSSMSHANAPSPGISSLRHL
jgi:hypothetical protein